MKNFTHSITVYDSELFEQKVVLIFHFEKSKDLELSQNCREEDVGGDPYRIPDGPGDPVDARSYSYF